MATTKVTTDVIDMSGNAGGLTWVKGTTAQQPSGVIGEIREDTETKRTLVYTNQVGTPPTISTCDYPAGAGAQALYQFDTATLTTDTCGNYSAGTNNNVTQNTTVKKYGTSSAEFNGTTADIDLEAGLDSTTMSVSFWIYIDATITTNGVVVELENGYGVWFLANAAGKLGVQNNNANNEATLSNAQLGTGAWHHVAAVWTGVGGSSNRTFYLDNVVQTGGTVSDYLTCDENTLGSRRSGEFFDGYLDQVRFYNTALTASQVDNLFNESSTSTGNEWRNLKEETAIIPFNVEYLIVAGGGAGGQLGGGGAGGLLTNYNGTGLSLNPGTDYTVTVGLGGAGNTSAPPLNNGTNSEISGSGITTLTATGGGAGAGQSVSPNGNGNNGGSGGGAGQDDNNAGTGGNGNTPPTTPSQGKNGGLGGGSVAGSPANGRLSGGGGGGAGAVGSPSAGLSTGGNGGNGLENQITGATGVFYAGGGGGAAWYLSNQGSSFGGTGGSSVGGNGGTLGTTGATDGAAGSGGGGGGAGFNGSGNLIGSSGSGGSGIVILRCTKATATLGSGITVNSTAGPGSVNGVAISGTSDYYYSATSGTGTITFS